jgi:hypothetical protein
MIEKTVVYFEKRGEENIERTFEEARGVLTS